MRLLASLLFLSSSLLLLNAADAPSDLATPPTPASPSLAPLPAKTQAEPILTSNAAVILGLVEGITEFLPISSTGHLIIASDLLGLESDLPLKDEKGNVLYHKKPSTKHPEGEVLTVKLAADTFTVVIQVGAIAAVLLLYWSQIMKLLNGVLGRDREGLLLLRNIFLAVVPVVILGLLVHDWIDAHLFSVKAVIVAQISGAVLMFGAERWRKQRSNLSQGSKDASDLTLIESLSIGGMQCLALWPGTSRSMVTIVGGYFVGLKPARAAEFSFLVGLPVLAGAALLKSIKSGPAMIQVFGWEHVLLGIVVAAISAAIAVKFLVSFLSKHGLVAFAVYRILIAIALSLWFLG